MKKSSIIVVLFLMLASNLTFAQLAKDSWAFGFGFDYPRFESINITPRNGDFGAYLSLQRNFSEHVGIRFTGGWAHMISGWTNPSYQPVYTTTDAITGDFDLLYYLVPCENISPYVFAGLGADYKMLINKATSYLNNNQIAGQANLGCWN